MANRKRTPREKAMKFAAQYEDSLKRMLEFRKNDPEVIRSYLRFAYLTGYNTGKRHQKKKDRESITNLV